MIENPNILDDQPTGQNVLTVSSFNIGDQVCFYDYVANREERVSDGARFYEHFGLTTQPVTILFTNEDDLSGVASFTDLDGLDGERYHFPAVAGVPPPAAIKPKHKVLGEFRHIIVGSPDVSEVILALHLQRRISTDFFQADMVLLA